MFGSTHLGTEVVTGYGLEDLRGWDSSPDKVKNFLHIVQTGSGTHPASYPMDTEEFSFSQ
jgi:hypothetical protein